MHRLFIFIVIWESIFFRWVGTTGAKKENEETVFYAEYRNTGEGAATASRASFGKQLNDISNYNEAQILAGDDGWNPVENGNVLLQNLKR